MTDTFYIHEFDATIGKAIAPQFFKNSFTHAQKTRVCHACMTGQITSSDLWIIFEGRGFSGGYPRASGPIRITDLPNDILAEPLIKSILVVRDKQPYILHRESHVIANALSAHFLKNSYTDSQLKVIYSSTRIGRLRFVDLVDLLANPSVGACSEHNVRDELVTLSDLIRGSVLEQFPPQNRIRILPLINSILRYRARIIRSHTPSSSSVQSSPSPSSSQTPQITHLTNPSNVYVTRGRPGVVQRPGIPYPESAPDIVKVCCVCLEFVGDTVIRGCGHNSMCSGCALIVVALDNKCPVCRQDMDHIETLHAFIFSSLFE